MKIDSYQMGRLTALFLATGASIPAQFQDRKPKPFHRDIEATDPVMIANIEKQGWHIRQIELTITATTGAAPHK